MENIKVIEKQKNGEEKVVEEGSVLKKKIRAKDKGIKQEAEEFTIVSRSCLSTDASSGGNFPHENPNGGLSEC